MYLNGDNKHEQISGTQERNTGDKHLKIVSTEMVSEGRRLNESPSVALAPDGAPSGPTEPVVFVLVTGKH